MDGATGGGSRDDMEARIKRLEDDSREFRADLKALVRDVAEIKGRINAMPTTWQMAGLIIAVMALSFVVIRFGLTGTA